MRITVIAARRELVLVVWLAFVWEKYVEMPVHWLSVCVTLTAILLDRTLLVRLP
jgi:hypothetical protein